MREIIVTGGTGQLGRCIKDIYTSAWTAYDNIKVSFPTHAEFDITDPDCMLNYVQHRDIACIINCAAYTNVNLAETDDTVNKINVDGVYNLVQLCNIRNIFFVQVSTDYVFEGNTAQMKDEDSVNELHPVNAYGRSKLQAENIIKTTLINYCIIRTSWLYSKYRNNFVKTIINKLLDNTTGFSEPIKVVQDQIGSPTYAVDLADFIFKNYILEFTADSPVLTVLKTGVYHFSNLGSISWYDFAIGIKEILSKYSMTYDLKDIVPVSTASLNPTCPRPYVCILSKNKIFKDFQYDIPYWKQSLDTFIADYILEINFP